MCIVIQLWMTQGENQGALPPLHHLGTSGYSYNLIKVYQLQVEIVLLSKGGASGLSLTYPSCYVVNAKQCLLS